MSFLYGNNVNKAGLARITEGTPQYAGVGAPFAHSITVPPLRHTHFTHSHSPSSSTVVYSLADVPLGFGVAAQPTEYCRDLEPTANVILHQGDIGEYLRVEDTM